MAGITELRFLKRTNLIPERDLYQEYFRDLIHSYGIDVKYFRKDNSFYKSLTGIANYPYGESPTDTYYLSANMVVFMEMFGDSFLLNKFGIETQGQAGVFFTIDDFNEQYYDLIGTPTSATLSSSIYCDINNFTGVITGDVVGTELTGITSASIDLSGVSGSVSGVFEEGVEANRKPVNAEIKHYHRFNRSNYGQRFTVGNLSGIYSGNINVSGDGVLTGTVSGLIGYNKSPAQNMGPGWKVAPQVGDFFRIVFEDENNEEYEITQVADRKLESDGINPLLGKYIWRCDVVRRDPSHETVVGTNQEEPQTTGKTEYEDWYEDTSDDIFDYDTEPVDEADGVNSDDVYGQY